MKEKEIYYFSGTGNSYVIAKEIAEKTNSKLINLAKAFRENSVSSDADTIGIVFPIYYMEMPQVADKFLSSLATKKNVYIFTVATFGGGKGGSLSKISKILNEKGCKLSAFYGIQMPQNAFKKPFDNYEKSYLKSKKMIRLICDNMENNKTGTFYTSKAINIMQSMLYPMLKKIIIKELPKKIDTSTASLNDTILNLDKTITVNDKCTHCGICMAVCPVKNIEFVDKMPVWNHKCENCLACYNFCPNKAINFSIAKEGYYYLHPDYTIRDAIDNNF